MGTQPLPYEPGLTLFADRAGALSVDRAFPISFGDLGRHYAVNLLNDSEEKKAAFFVSPTRSLLFSLSGSYGVSLPQTSRARRCGSLGRPVGRAKRASTRH